MYSVKCSSNVCKFQSNMGGYAKKCVDAMLICLMLSSERRESADICLDLENDHCHKALIQLRTSPPKFVTMALQVTLLLLLQRLDSSFAIQPFPISQRTSEVSPDCGVAACSLRSPAGGGVAACLFPSSCSIEKYFRILERRPEVFTY